MGYVIHLSGGKPRAERLGRVDVSCPPRPPAVRRLPPPIPFIFVFSLDLSGGAPPAWWTPFLPIPVPPVTTTVILPLSITSPSPPPVAPPVPIPAKRRRSTNRYENRLPDTDPWYQPVVAPVVPLPLPLSSTMPADVSCETPLFLLFAVQPLQKPALPSWCYILFPVSLWAHKKL